MNSKLLVVVLTIFLLLAITNGAPTSAIDGVLVIPEECKRPGFCAVKPEGYDRLAEKIDSVLPEVLWNLGN